MRTPIAKDVAKLAKVSVATVSRVVNNNPNVLPNHRKQVLQVIKKLGYQPSRTAQRLRAKRSSVIGLIISDIQNPFFTAVARGIEDVAYRHGYSVIFCNTDEDPEKEQLYRDVMRAEDVAGVILATTAGWNPGVRKIIESGIPVVAVDRRILDPVVDSVTVDSVRGSVDLTSHLIELGHRRIGFIGAPLAIMTIRERRDGYIQAHQSHGLTIFPELIRFGGPGAEWGYSCTKEFLQLDAPPTAIFSSNNMIALGVLRAIKEIGWRIPEDISVVCFNDMPWFSLIPSPLTVVVQPDYELGYKAAELMMTRLIDKRPAAPREIVLPIQMIVRKSSGPPPNRSASVPNNL